MGERSGLFIAGAMTLVAAAVLPFVVWASNGGSFEGIVVALVFTFIFAPLLFIVGVVLLIAGAVRSRGQQQQQQVVVMDRNAARAQGFIRDSTCPRCGGEVGSGERFCINCGVKLAHG